MTPPEDIPTPRTDLTLKAAQSIHGPQSEGFIQFARTLERENMRLKAENERLLAGLKITTALETSEFQLEQENALLKSQLAVAREALKEIMSIAQPENKNSA